MTFLQTAMKCAAQNFIHNSLIDIGNLKGADAQVQRFDRQLEDFCSVCDQIEMNLQAAVATATQATGSHRFVPVPVTPLVRPETQVRSPSCRTPFSRLLIDDESVQS